MESEDKIARELNALQLLIEQGEAENHYSKSKRPGSPRVEHKEQGKITIRLPERYQEKLQLIPEGRGAASTLFSFH
ncbi:MAG: hypothetical protein HQK53_03130 [Oligoflexia bacterium]|nr:hypothetical protein [Oligoflexia bacterium]